MDDGDDVYNWPWLYAVRPGEWQLTDAQAHKLRDYLLRGGFFMADDFWGTPEWAVFWESMGRVFPDRQAVELENSAALFHTIYDLDEHYQVTGAQGPLRPAAIRTTSGRRTGRAFSTTRAG